MAQVFSRLMLLAVLSSLGLSVAEAIGGLFFTTAPTFSWADRSILHLTQAAIIWAVYRETA